MSKWQVQDWEDMRKKDAALKGKANPENGARASQKAAAALDDQTLALEQLSNLDDCPFLDFSSAEHM